MAVLRSSPGGFNSARAQSSGKRGGGDDDAIKVNFNSTTGTLERVHSGNLQKGETQFNMHGTSESQRTLSNSNHNGLGGQINYVKQNTFLA